MATIIEMPKLSDTMTVGTLVKWLKNEGDPLSSGMMIAEIETDKATMELECFEDGTLLKQVAKIGDQIAVGAPICVIGKPGEDLSGLKLAAPAAAAPAAQAPAAAPAAVPPPPSAPIPAAPIAPAPAPVVHTSTPSPTPVAAAIADGRVKVSPLARKIAEQNGVDVSRLRGTGPGGRIVKADVLAAAEGKGSFVTAPQPKLPTSTVPSSAPLAAPPSSAARSPSRRTPRSPTCAPRSRAGSSRPRRRSRTSTLRSRPMPPRSPPSAPRSTAPSKAAA
jgi:pyruvate dehydrogenase E2 component (dihydrolipoamide acetyltransferase)